MTLTKDIKLKIAYANRDNPYVDITPYELQVGFPTVSYDAFHPHSNEILIYVAPAMTFKDKEQVVGYTNKSKGYSVRVTKSVSVLSGSSGGRAIRDVVRKFNSGDLLITNKRVIFVGKDDSFEFLISRISTVKLLDKNSFVIQSGSTSKNVSLDPSLVAYAFGFINYVINQTSKGVDIYSSILEVQSQITPEQVELCNRVRLEVATLAPSRKKKKKSKIFLTLVGILVLFGIISVLNSNELSEDSFGGSSSKYSDVELLKLEGHPKVYDPLEMAQEFYSFVDSDKVQVVNSKIYAKLQRNVKEFTDDENLIYLVELPESGKYLGVLHINLFTPELTIDMSLDKAAELFVSYLPNDFFEHYSKDISYSYGNDSTTIYIYSCRLNESGIAYHNEGHGEYSYYYSFYIVHYKDTNQWILKTDYSAYGDKGLDWIEKYSDSWDINLKDYVK